MNSKSITPVLLILVVVLNLPLIAGGPSTALLFYPDAVLAGELWRLISHPFVHVSLYHLLLDAGAFFLLWYSRPKPHGVHNDLILFLCCYAGSLGGGLLLQGDLIAGQGFCGLSGIGHALMAYQGVGWAVNRELDGVTRKLGWAMVLMVAGKSVLELSMGGVLFGSLHLGAIGIPVTACHAGGVAGGIAAGLLATVRPAVHNVLHPRQSSPRVMMLSYGCEGAFCGRWQNSSRSTR